GAQKIWFMTHEVLVGASQNIRDAFTVTNTNATCPGPTPGSPRVPCVQNIFNPVDIPPTAFPLRTGLRTRINDIGYYFFDRVDMARWVEVLGGVRKSDYTETSLDTGAVTFQSKPTSISYGAVVKPWHWMSIYGTYIEGLESTAGAPNTAVNYG